MNAPTKIDAIDSFMPNEDADKRAERRRLYICRDKSAQRATYCASDRARTLLWMANDIAGEWVFAPAAVNQLSDVLAALARIFHAANAIERLESGQ